jgi:hypothetical protein
MTYKEIQSWCNNENIPTFDINDDGENVIIEAGKNEMGKYYKLTTVQHNGWCRVNYYYEDGCMEETYEK